ncbi:hypothetical protein SEPCBS119000_005885 [Sporothrix epigloea]|uniref:N-acetyltransferase domain-containing protein n=1 Tax=Sporothrix epigloea TaxID=1892477 RepID=A0ABP0E326_9PEZI
MPLISLQDLQMGGSDSAVDGTLPQPRFRIDHATTPQDLQDIAELFLEYTSSLGIDLAYQSFDQELAGLPGKYARPHGVLLIARSTDSTSKPVGCVALRPLPLPQPALSTRSELKRLYVRPDARGSGLGEALARRALDEARASGYNEVVMDTLASMASARKLYAKLGFTETNAYYETPIVETIFFRQTFS